jgi:hypothetical protein
VHFHIREAHQAQGIRAPRSRVDLIGASVGHAREGIVPRLYVFRALKSNQDHVTRTQGSTRRRAGSRSTPRSTATTVMTACLDASAANS